MGFRTIKFRGKDVFSGQWRHGAYIPTEFTEWREPSIFDGHHRCEVDGETLGQDTGFKDADSYAIYEGDILDFAVFDYEGYDTHHQGVVKFAEGEWQIWKTVESAFYGNDGAFHLGWVLSQDDEAKVIGNIYDDPELLEGKK